KDGIFRGTDRFRFRKLHESRNRQSHFYLIPSIWLYKYSSAISRFLGGGGATELGNALVYQKSFWKYVGIMVLISMIVAILGILAAVFIPPLLMLLN
ncbi:MAG: hypothetical protein AB1Z29_23010, partial [Desulfobacterales bacterium]